MKKGDIVKLKTGKSLEYSLVLHWLPSGTREQEFYTVSKDAAFGPTGCGDETENLIALEEFRSDFRFRSDFFEQVLPSGHPDIKKLMEQSISSRVVV